mmetsp:Transcript_59241/g.145437  ORF Transcript_59241/g.145437 Transcript_59241/m.145437 type:complete len:231 (-) Transcript_59241:470-1162(-)
MMSAAPLVSETLLPISWATHRASGETSIPSLMPGLSGSLGTMDLLSSILALGVGPLDSMYRRWCGPSGVGSSAIIRSHHPSSVYWNCLTGMQSRNSWAIMMDGTSFLIGTSSRESRHLIRIPVPACRASLESSFHPCESFFLCASLSAGDVSTSSTVRALTRGLNLEMLRSMSSIIVPLPGPSSTSCTFSGCPSACHIHTTQMPTSSPNIWLISGAVTKSPFSPNTSLDM